MPRKGTQLYEDGGTVIEVRVTINGRLYFSRTAALSGDEGTKGKRFKFDNGGTANHKLEDDFIDLAKKMLKR